MKFIKVYHLNYYGESQREQDMNLSINSHELSSSFVPGIKQHTFKHGYLTRICGSGSAGFCLSSSFFLPLYPRLVVRSLLLAESFHCREMRQ